MAKKNGQATSAMDVRLKVVKHEIINTREKISRGVYEDREKIRVRLRGLDGDRKTHAELVMDPEHRSKWPFGSIFSLSAMLQQEMDYGGDGDEPEQPGAAH